MTHIKQILFLPKYYRFPFIPLEIDYFHWKVVLSIKSYVKIKKLREF